VKQKTVSPPGDILPGLQMRKARGDLAISLEEAAVSLGLSESSLRALESDDYEKLPALVYVRGYVRRYCTLLGIDPTPVLDNLDALTEGESKQQFDESSTSLIENPQVRMALYCVAAVLLLLVTVVVLADQVCCTSVQAGLTLR
tara:strand:- start:1287 stop:1718 length:432 start_codon:yes stop_codon:yes gene_type:complete